ncbi:MAG: adenylate/guanylate cyclase domain-containing protein [Actinobacteria bacterium]|nr:MAG: adenylate/guanylate cyclase domain-containing protein [Actinomycetota bacterium]
MPHARSVRQNAKYLSWLRAVALGGVTAIALLNMPFYPPYLIAILSLAVAALALGTPALGALLMVGVVALPVLAANFVVGALFLIVGFSATQYLGADRAQGFIMIVLAALAVAWHAEWAIAALAGYLMGAGPGAIAALLACLLIQVAGALLGMPHVGSVFTGGTPPGVVSFVTAPGSPLAFGWVADSIAKAAPSDVVSAIVSVKSVPLLVAQPLLWGLGAALGGIFHHSHQGTSRFTTAAGLGGVTVILAVASTLLLRMLGGAVSLSTLGMTALVSTLLAVAITLITELMFRLQPEQATEAPKDVPQPHGVRAEDADVDELLRLIASAEDELASRHTTERVVMLTDMKAFSAMTEEVGSMASAKLVQRQRDLLLPIIDRYNGHGKSTGGDGLVAAFETASDAVNAAIEMQRALGEYCDSGRASERMTIRIGIARGEVVLDKGGRPFIGAALNLAARVMDLADGGKIMATSDIADEAGLPTSQRVDLGSFDLKNIQAPVGVTEVLS